MATGTTTRAFSEARLARMHDTLSGLVARGELPGLVTLVSRRGETHVDAIGAQAFGGAPMRRDTVFRLASVTKPIMAVLAMTLVEECVLRIDEPIARWLPEFANPRVLARLDAEVTDTVPAARPITLRDVLTSRMGTGFVFAPPNHFPIQRAINALELDSVMSGSGRRPFTPHDADTWIARLASLPLVHQPGEAWAYNTSSHVLGVILTRALGKPLDVALRERVTGPLGMKDTAAEIPDDALARLATCYETDHATGKLVVHDGAEDSAWRTRSKMFDAGGGLLSTADDLLAFGRMLLAGGRVGDGPLRVLSRASVAAMTRDHIPDAVKAASPFLPGFWDARSWGFGMSVVTRCVDGTTATGRFGWSGGYTTCFYCDPAEDLVVALLTQRALSPTMPPIEPDFLTLAYASLAD